MEEVKLYGLDKSGGYKVWMIATNGDEITISHGKDGGKIQTKTEKVVGKNIGRTNETSPEEQAVLEAKSRINKQKDKGYRETKEDLKELCILPMLASDYLKQGHRIKFPCYSSRKLDGVRCLAIRHQDRVELKSRGGKEYEVEHVKTSLMECMTVGDIWDGELYIHGKYLEEIVSAVKKPNKDTLDLWFVVFDVVNDEKFSNRIKDVVAIHGRTIGHQVDALTYDDVSDEDQLKELHKLYVSEGYEGIMLRNYAGVYESGKRSADLQKRKDFMDEEFEIIGVREDRNGNAVFEVYDTTAKTTFTVTYGDFEQRKYQLNNPKEFIGKMLTVKYQCRYKDSKLPQFPTGVMVREGKVLNGEFIPNE